MGRLEGKVALISGGARGQGAVEARMFVHEGAKVVFGDILDAEGKQVEAEIRAVKDAMLRDVRLFDVYRGPNIPAGKKSLAYALTYQADDRTLTDKEVAKVHGKIASRLEKVLGAQLRA